MAVAEIRNVPYDSCDRGLRVNPKARSTPQALADQVAYPYARTPRAAANRRAQAVRKFSESCVHSPSVRPPMARLQNGPGAQSSMRNPSMTANARALSRSATSSETDRNSGESSKNVSTRSSSGVSVTRSGRRPMPNADTV